MTPAVLLPKDGAATASPLTAVATTTTHDDADANAGVRVEDAAQTSTEAAAAAGASGVLVSVAEVPAGAATAHDDADDEDVAPAAASFVGGAPAAARASDVVLSLEEMPGFAARRFVEIPGDGDCLFGAVAAVAGLRQPWQVLRLAAVAFLRCNPGRVLPNVAHLSLGDWARLVTNDRHFDDVLMLLESASEPGQYMLAVLAHLLGRPITVLVRGWNSITFLPEGCTASVWDPYSVNPDHLVVLYTGTHYDALVLSGAAEDGAADGGAAEDGAADGGAAEGGAADGGTAFAFTFEQILSWQHEEDATALVGTYSLRENELRPVMLTVRGLFSSSGCR